MQPIATQGRSHIDRHAQDHCGSGLVSRKGRKAAPGFHAGSTALRRTPATFTSPSPVSGAKLSLRAIRHIRA
ncbi:hypothetical protein PPUN109347_28670 [Pseudomonas putida]|nr:hypothetical protein PPUN109347_28670 [Pseudomonas putida]